MITITNSPDKGKTIEK